METDVTPNIVCTPLSAGNGRGKVEPPTKFSKKRVGGGGGGGLTGSRFLEEGCWERGDDLFRVGCSFYKKHNLKSEKFNDTKSLRHN